MVVVVVNVVVTEQFPVWTRLNLQNLSNVGYCHHHHHHHHIRLRIRHRHHDIRR